MGKPIRLLIAFVAIMTLVAVAGCGSGETDSPSELLVGTWETDLGGTIEVFNEDGTYSVGHTVDLASGDDVSQAELNFGTWSIDGNVLTRSSDPEAPYCQGMVGTYEIEFLDDGDRVAVTAVSDDCDHGRGDFASGLSRYMDS